MSFKASADTSAGMQNTYTASTGSRYEGGSALFSAFGPNPADFKKNVYRSYPLETGTYRDAWADRALVMQDTM